MRVCLILLSLVVLLAHSAVADRAAGDAGRLARRSTGREGQHRTGAIGTGNARQAGRPAPERRRNPRSRSTNRRQEKDTGAAVVICPGGGYNILAYDLEGTEVAEWLNSIGVTGIVLKYRVPRREGREKHDAPLQDAQRA